MSENYEITEIEAVDLDWPLFWEWARWVDRTNVNEITALLQEEQTVGFDQK